MKLVFLDKTSIILENVNLYNNLLGMCCTLGFKTALTEEQVLMIANNPIVSLTAADLLNNNFQGKKTKRATEDFAVFIR